MNRAIANILKTSLSGIPFVDKLAGLVYVAEYDDSFFGGNDVQITISKRIPLSCDVDPGSCDKNYLIPDSSKKGILYFEDQGITFLGKDRRDNSYSSLIRLVCWVNTDWIQNNTCTDAGGLLQNYCIAEIQKLNLTNQAPFKKIQIQVQAIPRRDKNIFSAYTYDEKATQFLIPPYDFFAIDFRITYLVPQACLDDISVRTTEQYLAAKNCTP